MAIGYVKGTVEKVLTGSFGVGLVVGESFVNREGQQKTTRFTAWFESDPGVNVGDAVEVSGLLSAKVDTWTGDDGTERSSAKISLNKSRIAGAQAPKLDEAPF